MTATRDLPDQPGHSDFQVISEALSASRDAEAQARGARLTPQVGQDLISQVVDPASALFAALQRTGHSTRRRFPSVRRLAVAAWLDGFIAGARYRDLKAASGQKNSDAPTGADT